MNLASRVISFFISELKSIDVIIINMYQSMDDDNDQAQTNWLPFAILGYIISTFCLFMCLCTCCVRYCKSNKQAYLDKSIESDFRYQEMLV